MHQCITRPLQPCAEDKRKWALAGAGIIQNPFGGR